VGLKGKKKYLIEGEDQIAQILAKIQVLKSFLGNKSGKKYGHVWEEYQEIH